MRWMLFDVCDTVIEHLVILESSTREKANVQKTVEDRQGAHSPTCPFSGGEGHIHPLVPSVEGLLHKGWPFPLRLQSLYLNQQLHQSKACFCWGSSLCLRGSCTIWRSGLGFDDSVPWPHSWSIIFTGTLRL